jgi:hypothetical protein
LIKKLLPFYFMEEKVLIRHWPFLPSPRSFLALTLAQFTGKVETPLQTNPSKGFYSSPVVIFLFLQVLRL